MARRPIGVVARHPADFNIRRAIGAALLVGASVGNLGHVELFNNASDGSHLYVWGLNAAGASATQFTLEGYYGQKGTITDPLSTSPLIIGGPLLFGVVAGFYSAACVGQHFGQAGAPLGGSWAPTQYPICVVPPGWSFTQECQSANLAIVCSVIWTVEPPP